MAGGHDELAEALGIREAGQDVEEIREVGAQVRISREETEIGVEP